jgi:cysteine desulfurase
VETSSTSSSASLASPVARHASTCLYLDYAAFAPVDPRVGAAMRPFLEGGGGNPSALHAVGQEARAFLEDARRKVARLLGGATSGLVFTASATEANNLAIKGVAGRAAGRHLVTSAIEHISVLNCCRDLEKRGYRVSHVPVDADGRVEPEAVAAAIQSDTVLVSVMGANGEIGTIEPIREIAEVTRARGVPLHVDAVHAAGRVALDVEAAGIDLLTVSANALYGPPGAGALWVRPGLKIAALVLGGGQEQGYRSGTENVPAIVGMGVAADLAREAWCAEATRLSALRDRLLDAVLAEVPGARRTGGGGDDRLPHHASLVVPGAKADAVLLELDMRGVAASSGSACQALTRQPSHVLRAIGCDEATAETSLCFTMGRWTTAADVDALIELLPGVVRRLRDLGPQ